MEIRINVPDELAPFVPHLGYFMQTMVMKLHTNRHKGFAEGMKYEELMRLMGQEIEELKKSAGVESQFATALEAIDVANFGFLLASKMWSITRKDWKEELSDVYT